MDTGWLGRASHFEWRSCDPEQMTRGWDAYPVEDSRPDATTHWQLPDTAWFAILAWAAGPNRVVATTDRSTREAVRTVCEDVDGTLTYSEAPFSERDQAEVDGDINDELMRVDLPARPAGLDWYLQADAGEREHLLGRINERVEAAVPDSTNGEDYLLTVRLSMEILVPEILAGEHGRQ